MQCKCDVNTEARSRNRSSRGKAISITNSECVCRTLFIQHANACAVLQCHMASLAPPYFFLIIP